MCEVSDLFATSYRQQRRNRSAAFGFYLIVLVLVPLYFVVLAVNDGAVNPTFAATIPLFGVGIPLLYFCVLDFLGRR